MHGHLMNRTKQINSEIERLLNKLFSEVGFSKPLDSDIFIDTDIYETDDSLEFEIELPGISKAALDVYVSADTILVEGVKKEHGYPKRVNYLCMEREFGKFYRLIEIPAACDTKNVKAVFRRGILHIILKKIEDRRGRRKKIDFEDD